MDRFQQVQRVLVRVLFANVAVAAAKLIVGLLTGTLSMIADGFHSSMDASSNIIGIAGARIAGRPPDSDHPYGHRRFETLATMAIGGLLLVAAWEILTSAFDRLVNGSTHQITPLSFGVMLSTMLINVAVVAYESRHGKRLRSEVLLADAAQTRMDLFISLSVIVGLTLGLFGLAWMDTLIALVIVGLIARTAFGILRQTTAVLVDAAALNPDEIGRLASGVPGVERVMQVRSRGAADDIHADVEVQVASATTADRAKAIAGEIELRLRAAMTGIAEVRVQFAPNQNGHPDTLLAARAAADALGLSIHEVTEVLTRQGLMLEMHVEVDPTLSLGEAHAQVSVLEQRLIQALPRVSGVVTHIEPASGQPGAVLYTARAVALRDQALKIAARLYPHADWHNAAIRPVMGGYALSIECCLPADVSVQEAHTIAEHVETQIRAEMLELQRVTIHTEPPEPA